jgi:putative ABC transport system permease protein
MKKFKTKKASFAWIVKMAWRDGKASGRKLVLFMASIVLGIAAVVAIQSFGKTLKENIALQSKALLGADFKIDSNKPPNEKVIQIMDSLGGADAKEISFSSMAAFPKTGAAKLIQVRGIENGFPFYGKLETEPPNAATTFYTQGAALVDATLLLQLDIHVGDSIKIGNKILPIAGTLVSAPGSNAIFSSIAAPVILPYDLIDATGLVQTGSRINYDFYFKAPTTDMQQLDEAIDARLDAQDADLDTHTSTSERLGRRYENFGKFLNLVAFIALLLGCVGIASAIHIYIQEKLQAVAILKCLGATKKQTFFIYLLQIAGMGLLGGSIGTVLGLLLQQLFPILLGDLLPVDVQATVSWHIVLLGLVLGVVMAVLFALIPLFKTLYVSPLEALRIDEAEATQSKKAVFLVIVAVFLFIFLFAYWLLQSWVYSISFVGAIAIIFAILAGIAKLFMRGIQKGFPSSWGFIARQSLLNLFRPQNQTLILIVAIGVGTFLISTLYFTKDILLEQASLDANSKSPNMILMDIQTKDNEDITKLIESNNLPITDNIPIVTMRLQNIAGKAVNDIRNDTTSSIRRWVLYHEFRVTYRDSLKASESLEQGTFTGEVSNRDMVPISVSDNFAKDTQVTLGDTIVFNVQGVLLRTIVGSIRVVDWSQMSLNFSILFPKGVLETAPQFRVLTTKVPSPEASAALQEDLVSQFPTISIIDLRQVLLVIENLLNKIAWLINFMAFFSILTGIMVLIGAVRVSKYQRIKENVLLRTIGARSKQLLRLTALEYVYLGVLGVLSGILLSLLSTQLLAWLVFETPFTPSLLPLLVFIPGITLLIVAIGVLNSIGVLRSPPLQVLRKEVN